MFAVSLGITAVFYVTANSLKLEVNQSKMAIKKLEEDTVSLLAEKAKIVKENEKLNDDLASHLGAQSKAKADKEKLSGLLLKAEDYIEKKEAELQLLNKRVEELDKESAVLKKEFQEKGPAKVRELSDKISKLEATLNQERAVANYNLAVAYEQAGFDDEAVAAYERSLQSDPKNADACYNLGLFYKEKRNDPEKAIKYLTRYLKLSSDAEDKAEVENWLRELGSL